MTAPKSVQSRSEESRVLNWQKDVAKSTAAQVPPHPQSTTRIIINHVTTPTVVVTRSAPEPKPRPEISTKAIIGTILGASAGAAVAYAMAKGEQEDREAKRIVYSSTEQPIRKVTETVVIVRPPLEDARSVHSQRTTSHAVGSTRSHHSISGPRVETVVSSNHSKREPQSYTVRSIQAPPKSHTSHHSARSNDLKPSAQSTHSRTSHRTSTLRKDAHSKTTSRHHSLSAAGIPLPRSTGTTVMNTVIPEESISQVSSRR